MLTEWQRSSHGATSVSCAGDADHGEGPHGRPSAAAWHTGAGVEGELLGAVHHCSGTVGRLGLLL